MIMFYISYGCSFIKGTTASFRVPWALQMIPAIILFFGMIILPESPRWLATKDRWEECERVQRRSQQPMGRKGVPGDQAVA
jgi:hypothetical protein